MGSRSAEKWRVPPCDFIPSCFCQAVAVRADVVSGHSPPPRGVKPVCSACPGVRAAVRPGRAALPPDGSELAWVAGRQRPFLGSLFSQSPGAPRRPSARGGHPLRQRLTGWPSAAGSSGWAGGRLCPFSASCGHSRRKCPDFSGSRGYTRLALSGSEGPRNNPVAGVVSHHI